MSSPVSLREVAVHCQRSSGFPPLLLHQQLLLFKGHRHVRRCVRHPPIPSMPVIELLPIVLLIAGGNVCDWSGPGVLHDVLPLPVLLRPHALVPVLRRLVGVHRVGEPLTLALEGGQGCCCPGRSKERRWLRVSGQHRPHCCCSWVTWLPQLLLSLLLLLNVGPGLLLYPTELLRSPIGQPNHARGVHSVWHYRLRQEVLGVHVGLALALHSPALLKGHDVSPLLLLLPVQLLPLLPREPLVFHVAAPDPVRRPATFSSRLLLRGLLRLVCKWVTGREWGGLPLRQLGALLLAILLLWLLPGRGPAGLVRELAQRGY
jgi:hypothetical protein